jgi:hypothetical protein
MRAGINEAFSEVYFQANKSRFKLGTPFINIYAIMKTSVKNVITAAVITIRYKNAENGLLRKDLILSFLVCLLMMSILLSVTFSNNSDSITFPERNNCLLNLIPPI